MHGIDVWPNSRQGSGGIPPRPLNALLRKKEYEKKISMNCALHRGNDETTDATTRKKAPRPGDRADYLPLLRSRREFTFSSIALSGHGATRDKVSGGRADISALE